MSSSYGNYNHIRSGAVTTECMEKNKKIKRYNGMVKPLSIMYSGKPRQ
jgi:hypothetical protein